MAKTSENVITIMIRKFTRYTTPGQPCNRHILLALLWCQFGSLTVYCRFVAMCAYKYDITGKRPRKVWRNKPTVGALPQL